MQLMQLIAASRCTAWYLRLSLLIMFVVGYKGPGHQPGTQQASVLGSL